MTRANAWRQPLTNVARKPGAGYHTVIRRGRTGWDWLLMVGEEVIQRGNRKSRADCYESLRDAKAQLRTS